MTPLPLPLPPPTIYFSALFTFYLYRNFEISAEHIGCAIPALLHHINGSFYPISLSAFLPSISQIPASGHSARGGSSSAGNSKYTETLMEILRQMPSEQNSKDHLKVRRNRQTDGQTDRQTDRQLDRQIDRWTDR